MTWWNDHDAPRIKYFMNPPQAVTERYVSNLIHYGRNKEFDIETITRAPSYHDNEIVGWFYIASIVSRERSVRASGATISQAVRRTLQKHGVTFR